MDKTLFKYVSRHRMLWVVVALMFISCKKDAPLPSVPPEPERLLLEEVVDANNRLLLAFTYNELNQLTKWEAFRPDGTVSDYTTYDYLQHRINRLNYYNLDFIQDLDFDIRFFFNPNGQYSGYISRNIFNIFQISLTYDASNRLSSIRRTQNDSLLYALQYQNGSNCDVLVKRQNGQDIVTNFEYDNFRRPDVALPYLDVFYSPHAFWSYEEARVAGAVSKNNITADLRRGFTWEYTYNQHRYPERITEHRGSSSRTYYLRYRKPNKL